MNIVEYCKLKNIKCLPIIIKIHGSTKTYVEWKDGGKFKDGSRNHTSKDFATYSVKDCQQLVEQYTNETTYIGIDTSVVQQLDIDDKTGEYNKSKMAEDYSKIPHFLSLTKKMPHYFMYSKFTKQTTPEIEYSHDILTKGSWAWCHIDTEVINSNCDIPTLSFGSTQPEIEIEVEDLENLKTDENSKYSKGEIDAIIKGLPEIAYEINGPHLNGQTNIAFNIFCGLKKMKAKRQVIKNLMMKAGTGFDKNWFNNVWTQDTSMYSYASEYVIDNSTWSPGCGENLIDEIPEDMLKTTCHDLIWNKFLEWSEKNQLVRVKDSYIVLEMKNDYYGEVFSKSITETINLFIESSKFSIQLFNGKNLQPKRANLDCFLANHNPHKSFPIVEYNWKYFGYRNGLYDIINDIFITDDFPRGVLCRKYFSVDFNPIVEIPSCLRKIYADQLFYEDTMMCHIALLGRSYYPINHIDDWGVVLVNYGVSNTGKSTTIEIVNRSLNQDKTTTLALSGGGSRFILANKNNQELLIINEAEHLTNVIPSSLFKSMCRGEKVIIEQKGIDEHNDNWNTPLLFASNTEIPYKDKSGGCGNRIIYFKHSVIITPDPNIKKELDTLIPNLVPYFCKLYLARAKCPLKLSKQMIQWNDDVAQNDDDFKSYINSENEDVFFQIIYSEGKSIKPKQLQDAYDKHVRYTLNDSKKPIKIGVNEQAQLSQLGIIKHRTQHCKSCSAVWKKDCCKEYSRANRVAKVRYINCEIIDGGLNKNSNDLDFAE